MLVSLGLRQISHFVVDFIYRRNVIQKIKLWRCLMDNLILDIDGTLLNGAEEINNATRFINYLEEKGIKYLLATNSIKSHKVQVQSNRQI
ncbi:hypothetical protein EW093_08600 [Thiospirochaeta perfilievii]|uniref:Uncharacterized protein n=2 Tax=Thiospirochaeta perfilievii TaxID=252967 RepID=A0A5C1QB65_9SPIO|nr:hypothetical protein EW093_08600 [Thiospirochaeta perfilievii]